MAIPLHSDYNKAKSPNPFVDSSNRTTPTKPKRHAHLRSSSASEYSSLRKSPPTCTVSLASVTTGPAISLSFPVSPNSSSSSSCGIIPFPSDEGNNESCGEAPAPEPWRRPRARTSHVETPRRAQMPPPPKSRSRRISKHRNNANTARSIAATTPSPRATPTPSDLRLAALVERSITYHRATRTAAASSAASSSLADSDSELDAQDALLGERLRALLALHGRRVRPASPTGIAPAACAPSVLLSGSESVLELAPTIATPAPTPAPGALRFVVKARARSGSRGSTHGNATLEMPALVATLMLRRHEGGRAARAGTLVLRRDVKRSALSPSPLMLGMHVVSASS
ncbi:hypothetical protein MVEN_01087100 [Mycena venus]|uniref:Uncharacterized protein n=1 Tax=Mycena venus TaxID=2733690 RepID=A0A8H6Y4G2_9AGAR|nr:hypothetical protein MVEN_01087100 [Mycena venus]